MTQEQLRQRVLAARARLDAAAGARQYTLLAATKMQSSQTINLLPDVGILDFGENRVQEWMEKHTEIDHSLRFHFIGRLQRNKIKYIIRDVVMIHSVDHIELAREIDRQARECGRTVDILIQVNPAREEQKGGVLVEELEPFVDQVRPLDHLRVRGLMCMAPLTEEESKIHAVFAQARACFERLRMQEAAADTLSMGMSSDAAIALAEGATLVRLGTALFGERS